MGLEKPHGCRSCIRGERSGSGGRWQRVRGTNGASPLIHELDTILAKLDDADLQTFKGELDVLLRMAQRGRLEFGPDGQVDRMACVRDVLELRIGDRFEMEGEGMHARLYFTEPTERPGVLLMLKIAAKRPGVMGLDEQDAHAQEAQRRYDEFRQRK